MWNGPKNVTLTTIFLDGARVAQTYRALPGQVLTEPGLGELLGARLVETARHFPGRKFRVVRLRDGNINLIEVGV